MAYAALLSLTRTLDNILLARSETLVIDKELHIKSLHRKLNLFISFLENTSQKYSDSIENLEERIRDAVYEAEDIIESHMSKQILLESEASPDDSESIVELEACNRDVRYEAENTSSFWDCARCLLSVCQNSEENDEQEDLEKKNYEIGIKNVMEKLDSIWGEVEKIKDSNNIEALQTENQRSGPAAPVKFESISKIGVDEFEEEPRNSSSSKSASTNTSAPMVGREDHLLRIKELLTGSSTELETISIVGMGGIGKTTLARSIYDDPFVTRRFDIQAWTTISQKYNVVALLIDLLKSMGAFTNEINGKDFEELKRKVYQNLKQRRYLIILDDVWDIDFLKEFKNILPNDNTSSRIIMTSQSSTVANFERYSRHIHPMDFLSPEQSWNLLRQRALGEEPCPPGVEEIGRRISEKCKGLPLSLVVIGGLLYKGKKTGEYWKYVEENLKSTEAGNYDVLMEILSWSYNNLPHHLKACFLYMAVYPEDYVSHVSHLVRLWLAEGFIKSIPPKNLEQVAMEYFEDLIARNLVIVRDRNYYGEIKTCTIHDLVRDLCMTQAQEKMFLHIMDKEDQKTTKNKRFLTFYPDKWFHFEQHYDPNVRSLLYFTDAYVLANIHSPLLTLRVLDACNIRFTKFPTEIVKLVNLRYLAFFYEGMVEGNIPTSISKLSNLQTLIVIRDFDWRSKGAILYLPSEMLKMPWLRHLLVHGSSFLSYPCGESNGNLQLLYGLINVRFTEDIIEKLVDLKTLEVVYRHDSETEWSLYCMENVLHLHQLKNLKFHFIRKMSRGRSQMVWRDGCQMPLNLSFPEKLNKLTLSGCIISWKHTSIIGSLPNLQVLKLKDVFFENSAWETNEGEFSNLKFLHIESEFMFEWEAEETHFPSLECLSLLSCRHLKCIPSGIGEIPTLRVIVLDNCGSDVKDSAKKILEEQREFGNGTLQLHIDSDKNDGFTSGICFHERYWYTE